MKFTILHNPHFGRYQGDHDEILVPARSIATVEMPAAFQGRIKLDALEYVYRSGQHGISFADPEGRPNGQGPWFTNPGVMAHIRSTSAGDLIADEAGTFFVVERGGFSSFKGDPSPAECPCCGLRSPRTPRKAEQSEAVKNA
jgi:hypothetical protein